MECINCGIDNNLKERTQNQGRCKKCGHQVVFEPKMKPAFSDLFFKNAIASLSTDRNYFFTQKQFNYFLENRLSQRLNSKNNLQSLITNFIYGFFISAPLSYVILNLFVEDINLERFTIISFCLYWLIWFYVSMTKINSDEQLLVIQKKYAKFIIILGIFASLFTLYCFFRIGFIFCLIITGISCFVIYMGSQNLRKKNKISMIFPLKSSDVNLWLDRWSYINGQVEQLLPPPTEENATTSVSPEISSYSFDRVVICDRTEIAQFLIANNFHFDHQCAVLSVMGYPQTIFSSVLEMLKRNPNLTVYSLHDASPQGVGLTYDLKNSPQWFSDRSVTVYDTGLRPSHVLNSKKLFIRNSGESKQQAEQISTEIRQTLSSEELRWLDQGNFVELESFPPRKLLNILAKMVNSNQTQWQSESTDSDYNNDSTDTFFYSSDTFG